MLPALRLVFKRGNTVAGIDGVFDAAAPLAHVVGQQQERLAPEKDDRHEVDEGHEGHRDVGQAPGQVERGERPKQHHRTDQHPVKGQHPGAAGDEPDIGLAVVVIPDNAAEGEEEDRHGDEDAARRADFADQCRLRKPYARQRGIGDSAEEDDEGRTGADHERVGKDPEGLDQPLLDRATDTTG